MNELFNIIFQNKEIIFGVGVTGVAAIALIHAVLTPNLDSAAEIEWGKRLFSFIAGFKQDK